MPEEIVIRMEDEDLLKQAAINFAAALLATLVATLILKYW